MSTTLVETARETLRTLPSDEVRQIMWRYADRYDLQMLVAGARGVARGPVARLVAEGERNSHDWNERKACPPKPGEERQVWRGAFALTEPLPYVGVETGLLSGKLRVAEWPAGQEPILQVDKRGRFITNMGFANFITAAVDSGDPRIKGSCLIILHEDDPGIWDRGTPTRKLVHQLSSTCDPVFSLKVLASRIIGGYGITEDCPGFLGHKWMDAQLEATYEGPEAVQRRQLSITMTNPLFLAQYRNWIAEMRGIASHRPGTGACTLATAMQMCSNSHYGVVSAENPPACPPV